MRHTKHAELVDLIPDTASISDRSRTLSKPRRTIDHYMASISSHDAKSTCFSPLAG